MSKEQPFVPLCEKVTYLGTGRNSDDAILKVNKVKSALQEFKDRTTLEEFEKWLDKKYPKVKSFSVNNFIEFQQEKLKEVMGEFK